MIWLVRPPQDHVVEIVNSVEHALVAAQHLVDREGPRREPAARAIGEPRGIEDILAPWLQPLRRKPAPRPRRLQRFERQRPIAANHLRVDRGAGHRLVARIAQYLGARVNRRRRGLRRNRHDDEAIGTDSRRNRDRRRGRRRRGLRRGRDRRGRHVGRAGGRDGEERRPGHRCKQHETALSHDRSPR